MANKTKKNITDGKLKPLTNATIEARAAGRSSFTGHNPSPTGDKTPLRYTGRLVKSIKATEMGVEGESYGLKHHEGYTTEGKFLGKKRQVPARPFLATEFDKKEGKVIKSKIIDKMNKAMKK